MRAAMLLCSMLLVMACMPRVLGTAAPPKAPEPPPVNPLTAFFITSEAWGGFTACGTKGRSWYPDETFDMDTASIAGIRAHEGAHRAKAAEFPTCDAWHAWLAVSPNRLMVEAFAFCVQARVLTEHGKFTTLHAAFSSVADKLLSDIYENARNGWPLTRETATDLISIACRAA